MPRTYTVTYMCRGALRGASQDFNHLQPAYDFFNKFILTDRELVAIELRGPAGRSVDSWIRTEE